MRLSLALITLLALELSAAEPALRWFKGNTHTHTLNSDGDSTPDEVVRWYREHGYDFVVITDHNFLTSVDSLQGLYGAEGKFLVIRGEELTDGFEGKPIHVNGLDLAKQLDPQGGSSVADTIQRNVDVIRAAKGVPHINHPNFGWAITADDLKKVRNDRLFEIFNGHPFVNNHGGGAARSLEEMWDEILTSGKLLYGIAVDDAHHFKRPWDRDAARPGQGWVAVRASKLATAELLTALENGEFYASTGVALNAVDRNRRTFRIEIRESGGARYTTQFVGRGGMVLAETTTNPAFYEIRGDEGYVRAKVTDSNGRAAWIQPLMLASPPKK
ncbi:MAG TPA: CehA/McbA family metallohydrolase [Thermoanaerobaculia bacterium]|nr:CehA/McbA family metallohydrolase [Thermoanaerobaculia bacterium]